MTYWLLKSEPATYGIDDLAAAPDGTDAWDGVRNHQARNFLRAMRVGDRAFFYHSNCRRPAVVGIVEVVREAYPDPTAFDPASPYHDPRADPRRPRWFAVDVRLVERLPRPVTLAELRAEPALEGLLILRRGNRLSVTPVAPAHWAHILAMARRPAP
ncbi:EVE domain-containing protein [Inmirania thermothiophila]|uniref:Putative RNA-binding protein with PUA-like domain n=1 Tax=Inmirania thermothiophila TaxID=1750597 RepID=A0A3N1YAR6_9GAMM|nr:EVE domain-containing protein [Inmirania thermothiophila]ROR34722.1 putative RNA-binding protein with PUA-like domain [Inmirania thermothiophila]